MAIWRTCASSSSTATRSPARASAPADVGERDGGRGAHGGGASSWRRAPSSSGIARARASSPRSAWRTTSRIAETRVAAFSRREIAKRASRLRGRGDGESIGRADSTLGYQPHAGGCARNARARGRRDPARRSSSSGSCAATQDRRISARALDRRRASRRSSRTRPPPRPRGRAAPAAWRRHPDRAPRRATRRRAARARRRRGLPRSRRRPPPVDAELHGDDAEQVRHDVPHEHPCPPAPSATAASTNAASRSTRVCARASRANGAHAVNAKTTPRWTPRRGAHGAEDGEREEEGRKRLDEIAAPARRARSKRPRARAAAAPSGVPIANPTQRHDERQRRSARSSADDTRPRRSTPASPQPSGRAADGAAPRAGRIEPARGRARQRGPRRRWRATTSVERHEVERSAACRSRTCPARGDRSRRARRCRAPARRRRAAPPRRPRPRARAGPASRRPRG